GPRRPGRGAGEGGWARARRGGGERGGAGGGGGGEGKREGGPAPPRSTPRHRPPVRVVPERLEPGMRATACHRPITTPSVQVRSDSVRWWRAIRSAAASSRARRVIEGATTHSERREGSMGGLKANPRMTPGRGPTRTDHAS